MDDPTFKTHGELLAADAEFHKQLGYAIAKWAFLERSLSLWFGALTRMPDKMASGIFYSARNFNGRSEMLEAATANAKVSLDLRQFLQSAIKKAVAYNSFRNRLAHGLVMHQASASYHIIAIGKPTAMHDHINSLKAEALAISANNFAELATIIYSSHSHFVGSGHKGLRYEESRERVHALPNQADSETSAPIAPKPKLPRKPRPK